MMSRPSHPLRLALLGSFSGLALAWGVILVTSRPTSTRPATTPPAKSPTIISSRATIAAAPVAAQPVEDPVAAFHPARSQASPPRAEANTAALVAACEHGHFQAAVDFILEASSDSQADLATLVFQRWGAAKPDDALAALAGFSDPALRTTGFTALVKGWAVAQPASLAAYATGLPAGHERTLALNATVEAWSLQDPAAFSAWLSQFPPTPELDQAAAALVLRADGMNRTPTVALRWAETITDPALRLEAITHAVREWSAQDAVAAANYLAQTSRLTPGEREQIRQSLARP
jgi:hypothetical protein